MFPVMFAIPRTSGWIAQWLEMVEDPEQKIIIHARFIPAAKNVRTFAELEQR